MAKLPGSPDLESLEAIDWAALENSHGPATDTPDRLRELLSEDPALRAHALFELELSICHQDYQTTEASFAAIPFLIAIVEWRQHPERDRIATLLADIARGNGWHQGAARYESVRRRQDPRSLEAHLEEEAELEDRIHGCIHRRQQTIASWLDDGSPETVAAALNALSVVRSLETPTRSALRACATQHPSAAVRMAARLRLALSDADDEEPPGPDEARPLFRLIAILAGLRRGRPVPAGATEALAAVMLQDKGQGLRDFDKLPGSPGANTLLTWLLESEESRQQLLARCIAVCEEADQNDVYRVRRTVWLAANRQGRRFDLDALTDLQRRALALAADCADHHRPFLETLRTLGLPTDTEQLRKRLGHPAGEATRRTRRPRWWPFGR